MSSPDLHETAESPSRREQQRLATRERVFEAAVQEFREAGAGGASIDRIARHAGVSRGTFYFHFPTREHVLIELQRRLEKRVVRRIARHEPPPRDIAGWIRLVMAAVLAEQEALDDSRLVSEIMAMYIRAPIELDPLRDGSLPAATDGLFQAAIERGEVRSDIEPGRLSRLFLTQIYGCMIHGHEPPDEKRAVFDQMVDVFLRGISP